MTKVTSFNPSNLQAMRADMTKAMAEIEAKYSVQIGIGKMSYTENDFNCKLNVIVRSEVPVAESGVNIDPKWVSDFMRNHFIFGIAKDDLGKTKHYKGKVFKLVGSRSRANLPLVVQEVGTANLKTFSIDAWSKATA